MNPLTSDIFISTAEAKIESSVKLLTRKKRACSSHNDGALEERKLVEKLDFVYWYERGCWLVYVGV
jgi:hypothetical protein